MRQQSTSLRGKGVWVVVIAGVVLGGLAATGSFGLDAHDAARSGPIAGCADRKDGTLAILSRVKRCPRGTRKLTWSAPGAAGATGQRGPAGARGQGGPMGEAGDQGPAGTFEFDDLDGTACTGSSGPSTVDISFDSEGFVTFTC